MSYTRFFNPERFLSLQSKLDEILSLSEGKSLDIRGDSSSLARTRWLVYDYLSHMGRGREFKIRRLSGRLIVERKLPIQVVVERSREDFLSLLLSQAIKEKEPGTFLRSRLSGGLLARALEKFGRIVGEGEKEGEGEGEKEGEDE